jgi:hypothetical protein
MWSRRGKKSFVACEKCGRLGRYSMRELAMRHGRGSAVPDWIGTMTKGCPPDTTLPE